MIFEGDCKELVTGVFTTSSDNSKVAAVIYDIKQLMSNCDGWQISFNHEEMNIVAHFLARHALSLEGEYVWMEECPLHVLSAVLDDQCN